MKSVIFFGDQIRMLRRFSLLLHVIAAGTWIYLMPGGFPFMHLRFLANCGIPAAAIVLGVTGIYADRTSRAALLHAIVIALAAGWCAAAVTGIVIFPVSARFIFPMGLLVGLAMAVQVLDSVGRRHLRSPLTIVMALMGAATGLVIPFTQRAELPTTHPLNGAMEMETTASPETVPEVAPLAKSLRVMPADGTITFLHDRLIMTVQPMLTFLSRSPDRCWTLFAPRESREASARSITRYSRDATSATMRYADAGRSTLRVSAAEDGVAEIEATSQIPDAIYSHLNTFCEISLTGPAELSLVFSPCPGEAIDVLPMDYPVGRPSRFAYLASDGTFHVVEASSGEKGPYHELTSGKLGRDQPLEITFCDAGRAFATVVLKDWAAQLSTDLSPTAGWGVPQNAIEFSLDVEGLRSGASLFISLASTSVGRGFDSVGHTPGVYRNRMSVRLLPP